jgi:hypothetical protein
MEAKQEWISQLNSESVDDQLAALRRIAGTEAVTGITVPVVTMVGSGDSDVRMWAAEALERAVDPGVEEAESLAELLDASADDEVGYWAATMLGRLGHSLSGRPSLSAAAVAALDHCLRHSSYLPARERAVWAVCQMGPASRRVIPTLRRLSHEAPPRLQRMSANALRRLESAAA